MESYFRIEEIILFFQQFGRIPLLPQIHLISNTFLPQIQFNESFSLYSSVYISSSPENLTCVESLNLMIIDATIKRPDLGMLLDKTLKKTEPETLVVISWTKEANVEAENFFKTWFQGDKVKVNSNLFVFLSDESVLELYSVGRKLVIRHLNAQSYLTGIRRNFLGETLIGTHSRSWKSKTRSGSETLRNVAFPTKKYDILSYTQDFLNFTLQVTGTTYEDPDNTSVRMGEVWSGILEQVTSGVSDFSISDVHVLPQLLAQNVRFLTPHTEIHQPEVLFVMEKDLIMSAYDSIFSTRSWIGIGLILILGFISRVLVSSPKERFDSFVWLIAIVSQQNWEEVSPPRISQRIVTLSMSIPCLIIYTLFCSGLISSLSIGTAHEETVESLVKRGYKFGISNTSLLIISRHRVGEDQLKYDFYMDIRNDRVYKNMHPEYEFTSVTEGLGRVLTSSRYGFIGPSWKSFLLAAAQFPDSWPTDRICEEMKKLTVTQYSIQRSSIFRKDSPNFDLFKQARMTMKERGIEDLFADRHKYDDLMFGPSCKGPDVLVSFELQDVAKPFSVLLVGMLIAIFSLFVEKVYKSKIPSSSSLVERIETISQENDVQNALFFSSDP